MIIYHITNKYHDNKNTDINIHVNIDIMVNNIDHICQLAGNSNHVGIGTDLDGAFGKEQCPDDLETIADLQILPQKLELKGYKTEDIENILSTNFINFLKRTWST